jgi:phage tail sheath protein FI
VEAWREALGDGVDPDALSCAALYWPWLKTIDRLGGPVIVRPPLGYVAGIFARRDIAVGPHAAPANEPVIGAVGSELHIDDRLDARIYAQAINPCRAFAGRSVQLWGARTLRWREPASTLDRPDALGFINVRRCLSSIARSVERIGQMFAFEPNGAILRFGLVQAIASYLISVHRAGALVGRTPTEAFFVRCDDSINPPSAIAAGEVVCEIGVAIAAPAEFLIFRVGRRAGVIELKEVS